MIPIKALRGFDTSDLYQECHVSFWHDMDKETSRRTNLGGPSGPPTLTTVYSDFDSELPINLSAGRLGQNMLHGSNEPSKDGRRSADFRAEDGGMDNGGVEEDDGVRADEK